MLDKKPKLFHFLLVAALLLAMLGPVVASGKLFRVRANPNLTQAAGQATSLSGAREDGSVPTQSLLEFMAVSWNSGVFGPPPFLAVSWNSGISVDVSWNS